MVPATFLAVHSGFYVTAGVVGTRATRAYHLEPGVQEGVECLLEERVFEEESGRVSSTIATVDIATLVERLAEHLTTQRHSTAHQNAPQLPELDIGDAAVPAEGERSAVPDHDEAALARSSRAGAVAHLGGGARVYVGGVATTAIVRSDSRPN